MNKNQSLESYRYGIINFSKKGAYWSNMPTREPPKSDPKKVFSIDKRDRHSLYLLMKSGVNLITLADVLGSKDLASVQYALSIFEQHTKKLFKYINKYFVVEEGIGHALVINPRVLRRIKNIQKSINN